MHPVHQVGVLADAEASKPPIDGAHNAGKVPCLLLAIDGSRPNGARGWQSGKEEHLPDAFKPSHKTHARTEKGEN